MTPAQQVNEGVTLGPVRVIYQSVSVSANLGTEQVTNTKGYLLDPVSLHFVRINLLSLISV